LTTRRGDDRPGAATDLAGGDEAALADVYARWSPFVYSLALRSLRDVGKAEEVTQRVFTRVWGARDSLDADRPDFPGWLVDLCRSSIAETRASLSRRTRPGRRAREEESEDDESRTAVLAERFVLMAAMSHLSTTAQAVLRLAFDEHLSHIEIAGRTGLGIDEVKHHIANSLIELRQRTEVRADAH
jgi:RNA polymerase sigma factor (sigma-70 family)